MQKKFLTNLGLIIFLNLIVKPFWVIGIDAGVQNAVGSIDYGFYFSVLNFSFLFNMLLDLGITNFNNRNIAQSHHLLNKHFSSIILLKILLLFAYLFVTFIMGWIIGYNSIQFKMLIWVAFNQFLLSFLLYLRSNISGLLLFRTDSFLSVLDRTLMIIIISVLLWGNIIDKPFRIEWFVYAQTSAYFISVIIALIIVIRKSAFKKLRWNKVFFLLILKKSFPFALLILLMTSYNRIDSVIIERMLTGSTGDEQAGIYAMGFRLLDASNQIAYLFAVLLLPLFSYMIKHKENINQIVKISFTLLITISSIAAIGSYFYSTEIMELIYHQHETESFADFHNKIDQASHIFGLLMFGFIAISSTYVFGTLLTANGNLKILNIVAASGMILSLILNLLLVPKFQALGSAYASLTAQGLTAIIQMVIAIKILNIKFNRFFIWQLFLFIGGIVSFNLLSKLIPGINWKISFVLMIIAGLGWSFMLRFLNIREFYKILTTKEA